jgi:hypothetical protein
VADGLSWSDREQILMGHPIGQVNVLHMKCFMFFGPILIRAVATCRGIALEAVFGGIGAAKKVGYRGRMP